MPPVRGATTLGDPLIEHIQVKIAEPGGEWIPNQASQVGMMVKGVQWHGASVQRGIVDTCHAL